MKNKIAISNKTKIKKMFCIIHFKLKFIRKAIILPFSILISSFVQSPMFDAAETMTTGNSIEIT